ncbi:hypothetical protein SDC9_36569 [bioreactor metagenome]|uniref:Uncharacterized protein n=1 Tax=bioreactor metagenome TaxID=1076179 RepID=A0A644VH03_9ZZZZ
MPFPGPCRRNDRLTPPAQTAGSVGEHLDPVAGGDRRRALDHRAFAQKPLPHPPGRRPELDPPGLGAAKAAADAGDPLAVEEIEHEIDVLLADVREPGDHPRAAEDLGAQVLPLRAALDQRINQQLHRIDPKACRLDRVTAPLGQQEVVHPADPRLCVEETGGDAGAENGRDRPFVRTDDELALRDEDRAGRRFQLWHPPLGRAPVGGAAQIEDRRRHLGQGDRPFRRPDLERRARHAEDDRAVLVLCQTARAALPQRQHPCRTVTPHAGEQHRDGPLGHRFGRAEQDVDRRPIATDLVAAPQPAAWRQARRKFEMRLAARRHCDHALHERLARAREHHARRDPPGQPLCEARQETLGHVLGDQRRRAVFRIAGKQGLERIDAAGRGADQHEAAVPVKTRRRAHLPPRAGRTQPRPGSGDEQIGQVAEGRGKAPAHRLADALDRAKRQRLERRARALLRLARYHHHRQRAQPHQLFEEGEPVHPRHLDIERQHIGLQRLDQVARLVGVGGLAHDLEPRIGPQHRPDQAADRRRVVHDQHPFRQPGQARRAARLTQLRNLPSPPPRSRRPPEPSPLRRAPPRPCAAQGRSVAPLQGRALPCRPRCGTARW